MRPARMCAIAAVAAATALIAMFAPAPGRRRGGDEQHDRQSQVAEHEPDEPAAERDEEAPDGEQRELHGARG